MAFRKAILRYRRFYQVALVGFLTVLLGAVGIFMVERDANRAIGSFADALWWAIVTVTTVGYGDVSPVTVEGRMIAAVLMFVGIGVIGVFTATLATFFLEEDKAEAGSEIEERLERIERKLEEIGKQLGSQKPPSG